MMELTRNERREKKRDKKRKHKTSGKSVRLLWELAIRRAQQLVSKEKRC